MGAVGEAVKQDRAEFERPAVTACGERWQLQSQHLGRMPPFGEARSSMVTSAGEARSSMVTSAGEALSPTVTPAGEARSSPVTCAELELQLGCPQACQSNPGRRFDD